MLQPPTSEKVVPLVHLHVRVSGVTGVSARAATLWLAILLAILAAIASSFASSSAASAATFLASSSRAWSYLETTSLIWSLSAFTSVAVRAGASRAVGMALTAMKQSMVERERSIADDCESDEIETQAEVTSVDADGALGRWIGTRRPARPGNPGGGTP